MLCPSHAANPRLGDDGSFPARPEGGRAALSDHGPRRDPAFRGLTSKAPCPHHARTPRLPDPRDSSVRGRASRWLAMRPCPSGLRVWFANIEQSAQRRHRLRRQCPPIVLCLPHDSAGRGLEVSALAVIPSTRYPPGPRLSLLAQSDSARLSYLSAYRPKEWPDLLGEFLRAIQVREMRAGRALDLDPEAAGEPPGGL
jgi:hypothetical protein